MRYVYRAMSNKRCPPAFPNQPPHEKGSMHMIKITKSVASWRKSLNINLAKLMN